MRKLLIISVVLAALVSSIVAQDACHCRMNFTGNVTNPEGRRLNNAVVTLYGCFELPCTRTEARTVRTNTFGYFTFRDLLLTEYVVEIRAKAHDPLVRLVPMYEVVDSYTQFVMQRISH